jgi:hypothetical protein
MPRLADKRRFCGDIDQLQLMVAQAGVHGGWRYLQGNMWQLRLPDGAVLNFWPFTLTINFQGPAEAAAQLEATLRAYWQRPAPALMRPSLPRSHSDD